jgi:hypothetical protein
MQNPSQFKLLPIVILAVMLSACTTTPAQDTATPTRETGKPDVIVSGVELSWPELASAELCAPNDSQPEIKFCLLNDGTEIGSVPEDAYLMLPAGVAPGAAEAVLAGLPGYANLPEPLIVGGLSGVSAEIVAMSLTGSPPEEEEGFPDIAFLCIPTPQGCTHNLLLYNPPEPGGQSEGLWIGPPDLTGHSQVMGVIVEDKPGEDGSEGIVIVDSMPTGGEEGIVIVDSIPTGDEEGIVIVDSLPAEGELGIIVVDSMPIGDWKAQGIIVVDSMPGSGESAEGIIVVDSMPGEANISHVMGIVVEDKPAEAGSEGIIVVDTMPVEGEEGAIWTGMPAEGVEAAIWTGMPTGSENGIIVVDTMPVGEWSAAAGLPGFSLPFGFDPEGMMAMMGEGGFGPGPKILMKLNLSELGLPGQLAPGEEACILLQPQLIGGGGGEFPAESFFDVFVEIDAPEPSEEDAGEFERQRFPAATPPYAFCTPTPTPTSIPLPPTPTPTPRQVIQPTPTVRTGNPTSPPDRRAPTATPARR